MPNNLIKAFADLRAASEERIHAADKALAEPSLANIFAVCEVDVHNRVVFIDGGPKLTFRRSPYLFNRGEAEKVCADFNAHLIQQGDADHPLHVIGVYDWYAMDKADALSVLALVENGEKANA